MFAKLESAAQIARLHGHRPLLIHSTRSSYGTIDSLLYLPPPDIRV
jgi:hypothetical protein